VECSASALCHRYTKALDEVRKCRKEKAKEVQELDKPGPAGGSLFPLPKHNGSMEGSISFFYSKYILNIVFEFNLQIPLNECFI